MYSFLYIICFIFFLSLFQKLYYLILFKIANLWYKINFIYRFIIRFWVIIHELSHMFFAILTWNKISKVDMFKDDGGEVIILSKNYIWELPKYWFSFNFILLMVLNQIGLFLVSFWPLLFWIIFIYLFCNYLWIYSFYDIINIKFNFLNSIIIFFLSIFIPSFVLSFQDIKWFFVSNQEYKLSTLVWSLINSIIFVLFLFIFWDLIIWYFIIFCFIFLIMFLLQLIFYILLKIFYIIFNSFN